jgi:hypothetical protein
MKWLGTFLSDFVILAGCGCIVYGLFLWNIIVAWVMAGLLLIAWGVLIGLIRAKK